MRHRIYGAKLNKQTDERKATFRNLAKAVFLHGRVETTEARAKAARGFIEKIITKARNDDLVSYRKVLAILGNDKKVTKRVVEKIAPSYKERKGGYTRIIRTRRRLGDNAEMAYLELVDMEKTGIFEKKEKAKKSKKKEKGKEESKVKGKKENVKKRD